jgi:hypothetical protein
VHQRSGHQDNIAMQQQAEVDAEAQRLFAEVS